jgi:hypothetical protein
MLLLVVFRRQPVQPDKPAQLASHPRVQWIEIRGDCAQPVLGRGPVTLRLQRLLVSSADATVSTLPMGLLATRIV